MIPLNGKGKFRQGIYNPKNSHKYIGKEKPVYRSSFELKFLRWCDLSENVLEFSSESIIIPYVSPIDNKVHRYYVDGVLALREKAGVVKYIVEIKPYKQTLPPDTTKNKRKSTLLYENTQYLVNQAKWKYAREWAEKHGFKFVVLTEKELGIT